MGAVRFRGEMRDTTGDEWRVDIYDSQYTGSPDSITLAEDGWALTWNGDIRNKVNPILTSEAVISFVMQDAADENLMTLIAGNVEGRFTVAIYQVIATVPVLFWTGTVLTDQVAYLDEYYPIRAEIRATDDIGALQDVPYDDDGTPYASNGYKTVIGHVHEALLKTRQVANFYASTDNFLTYANDFYSVDDDVSVTDHLNSTRIYNLTWNNPNDEGVNQIVSTYEVLESICLTYNARLFQYAGNWYFLPIGVYQYDETAIACERLKFDGTSGTSFTYSNPFQEVGSGLKKLRGWRVEYYQPYKQVNRTQVYSGNIAIISRGAYNLKTSNTLNDPDLDYASGELLKLSGDVVLTYDGDGTTTGNARVGRFLVRVTLKVGTYYLRRDVTFSGTSYDFQMEPGTVLEYTTGTMGDTTWNATAETFDTLTPTFDRNQGATAWSAVTYTMEQILPGLPTGLSGVEFSAALYDVDENGTLTLATSSTYTGIISELRVDWVEENQTNGDTILWKATGQDTNRGTLDQGQTYIGDLVSANSRGVLKVIGSLGPQNSSGWRSLNVTTGSLTIHRLGTQEVQALHNVTTKGYQGTLHSEILGPVHLLKDGGDYYMPTSISIQANERYTDFQGFRLTRDLTSITSDDDGRRDVNDPVGGTTGTQTGLEAVAFTTSPGITSVNGDTGPAVDLDAADIAYGGGVTVKDQIADNATDITAVKSVVNIGATTVDFWDGNTGTHVDTTANDVSLQVDKTDVLVVTGTTITNKQATTVESTLKTTGTLTAETGVGVTNILAKNSSTKAVIALQDSGSTDANQVAIASSGDGMVLQTGGATAVSIDSTGQVGIGVVAPTVALDVDGFIYSNESIEALYSVTANNRLQEKRAYSPWDRVAFLMQRQSSSGGSYVNVGGIGSGAYGSDGSYSVFIYNAASGTKTPRGHVAIYENDTVAIGTNRINVTTHNNDAQLQVECYYHSGTNAVTIKTANNSTTVTSALIIQNNSNTVFYQIDEDGTITHTGDTTQTGDVSVTGTVTSTGVTKASGLEATSNADSLVLKSPDGTRWRVTVDNSGNLTTTSL